MALLKFCHRCGTVQPRDHTHRAPDTRPSARARGYDREWERTRAEFIRAFPICQHQSGCLSPTTDVHHLDGKGPKGPRGHDWANLQALCHSHHSQLTAAEQPGGFHRAVQEP
jgi:5-methylcytosine-specific restriction protein A